MHFHWVPHGVPIPIYIQSLMYIAIALNEISAATYGEIYFIKD